jgi:aldose sugar dehydrogenase
MTRIPLAALPFLSGLVVLAACGGGAPTDLPLPGESVQVGVDTLVTGLDVPWDLAFAADGRTFAAERSGRIRVIEEGRLRPEPWATLDVAQRSEMGLMGLALHPDFAENGYLYVVGTFAAEEGLENRVYRFTERGERGTEPRMILGGMPAARFHAGAALRFGPDGFLYVSVGDATRPAASQEMSTLAGKILRVDENGGVPADNPFPGTPIFALGLRNPQGLAWHPETGELFASDHGPSGLPQERFRRGRDELNVIIAGGNYGWPEAAGDEGGEAFLRPLVEWTPGIAPAGIDFYTGPSEAWRGSLFVGGLAGARLVRVVVERSRDRPTGWDAVAQESLFQGEWGRIRVVRMGPDGYLYIATSNRDGRGNPSPADDVLLRLLPGG